MRGLVEEGKGITEKKKNPDTDISMVAAGGKVALGEVEEGKGEVNGGGKRLDNAICR